MIVLNHDWRGRVWHEPSDRKKPWRAMLQYGYMVRDPDDPAEWSGIDYGPRKYRGVKKFRTEHEATEWAADVVRLHKEREATSGENRQYDAHKGSIVTVDVPGMPTIDVVP